MYRIASDSFIREKHARATAVFCLTETVKAHVASFFEKGYESENSSTLYKKVLIDKARSIFPDKILAEMTAAGVTVNVFIPKKIAQIMTLLNSNSEIMPDVFNEYVLERMAVCYPKSNANFAPRIVTRHLKDLKQLISAYLNRFEAKTYSRKQRKAYIVNAITSVSRFSALTGENEKRNQFAFWDNDRLVFEKYGFEFALRELAYGSMTKGYGYSKTRDIFTTVNETVPYILDAKSLMIMFNANQKEYEKNHPETIEMINAEA